MKKLILIIGCLLIVVFGFVGAFAIFDSQDDSSSDVSSSASSISSVKESQEVAESNESQTTLNSNQLSDSEVEISLLDNLDGILNSYCLDIAGGNENVDPSNGLQAHTCYSYDGDLGTDQVFQSVSAGSGQLYMPVYDVCAQADSRESGSEISLGDCDDTMNNQTFTFNSNGSIALADTDLCVTAAEESRMGKGSQHQIRDLSLQVCSDDSSSYQQWGARESLEGGINNF